MKIELELINAYQEMSNLTAPHCGKSCIGVTNKYRCCCDEYCQAAIKWAKERWGIVLEDTGLVPGIPLMGEHGCIAAPHLRPSCTNHICAFNRQSLKWREQRKDLLIKIIKLEEKKDEDSQDA